MNNKYKMTTLLVLANTFFGLTGFITATQKVHGNMKSINTTYKNPTDKKQALRYVNRKLIFYRDDCPTCQKSIPSVKVINDIYYGLHLKRQGNNLPKIPLYLNTNVQSNKDFAKTMGINSVPSAVKINYEKATKKVSINRTNELSTTAKATTIFVFLALISFATVIETAVINQVSKIKKNNKKRIEENKNE